MNLNILRLTYFLILKKESIDSTQFNGKFIRMIFLKLVATRLES